MKLPPPPRAAIPILLALLGLAVVGAGAAWDWAAAERRAADLALRRAASLAALVAPTMERAALRADPAAAQTIDRLALEPDLSLAAVVDDAGRVLYATASGARGQPLAGTPAAPAGSLVERARATRAAQAEVDPGGAAARAAQPFSLGLLPGESSPSRTGVVYVELDMTAARSRALADALQRALLMACAAGLVASAAYAAAPGAGGAAARPGGLAHTLNQMFSDLLSERAALQESEARYRQLIESAPMAIAIAREGRFIYVNPAFAEMHHLRSPSELIGQEIAGTIAASHRAEFAERARRRLQRSPAERDYETVGLRRDGSEFPVLASASIVELADGPAVIGFFQDITERRRADERLRESEEKFAKVFRSAPVLMSLTDVETGRFTEVNDEAVRASEFTREEIVGRTSVEIGWITQEVRDQLVGALRAHGRVSAFELQARAKSGRLIDCLFFGELITIGGRPQLLSITQDISERKRTERHIAESEALYRTVVSSLSEGLVVQDQRDAVLMANEAAARILGLTMDQLLGRDSYDPRWQALREDGAPFRPEDHPSVVALRTGLPVDNTVMDVRTGDGRRRLISINARPVHDPSGAVTSSVTSFSDITERRLAENKLRESEALYRKAIEVAGGVPYRQSYDETGLRVTYDFIGEGIRALTGYGPEEFTADLWDSISDETTMVGELAPFSLDEAIRRVRSGEFAIWKAESRFRTRDGSVRWLFEAAIELRDEAGVSHGSIGMFQDITERKQAEEALRRSEAKFRAVVENSNDGILFCGADSTILYRSPSYWKINGYQDDERLGQRGFETVHPADIGRLRQVWAAMLADPQTTYKTEYRVGQKGGGWRWIDTTIQNLLGNPSVQAVIVASRDVSERKAAEERIQRQLDQMRALSDIDRAIISSFDMRLTLAEVLTQTTQHLRVDAAGILLLNPGLQTLEYAAGRGFRSRAIERASVRLADQYPALAEAPEGAAELLRARGLAGEGFQSYRAVPLRAKGELKGVLEIFHRSPLDPDQEWVDFLHILAGQAAIAIDNAGLFENLQRSNVELRSAYDATIEGWSRALDLRDKETEGHTQRVAALTLRLARAAGMGGAELEHIRRGALLHDIGKMGIPDSILLKPGPLTDEEWVTMRKHPTFAYELLSPIDYLKAAAIDIPYCHHERWDGTGYPRGLKGHEIPLAARVFSVADVWDALTSDRPYRAALPPEAAAAYIAGQSGRAFDPEVVRIFTAMLEAGELGA